MAKMTGRKVIEDMIRKSDEEYRRKPSWLLLDRAALEPYIPIATKLCRRAEEAGLSDWRIQEFAERCIKEIHEHLMDERCHHC